MSTRRPDSSADSGFTLVEAIAALVIFAGVVVVLQTGFAGGLRGIKSAQKDRAALDCARSVLTAAGNTQALAPGQSESGSCNDIAWSRDVAAYEFKDGDRPPAPLTAYWVDVTVTWRDWATSPQRSLHLRTLKIGRQE